MSPRERADVEERDLLAYVDGRLAPERGRAVERWLADRPQERARLDAYACQNEALRRHLGGVAAEPVPPALRAVVYGTPRADAARRRGFARPAAAAALATLFCLSGGLGWWLGQQGGGDGHARDFVAALTELPTPPAQAGASVNADANADAGDGAAPLDWFEQTIAMDLRAPDLGDAGWRLHRRVLVDVDGRATVRLGYVDASGRELEIYLRKRWSATRAEPEIAITEHGDVRAAHWYDGPLVWAVVGELAASELARLGRRAHGSMRLRPVQRRDDAPQVTPLDQAMGPHRPSSAAHTDHRVLESGQGKLTIE